MFNHQHLHKDEKGQTALEAAIILIAFIVVASVFAFVILSAGSASTDKSEEAIYAGLEGVQSSMSVKGAIIAKGAAGSVSDVVFTLALVAGGDPVDLTDTTGNNVVVIGYRDGTNFESNIPWTVTWIVDNDGGTPDAMLEDGELAEVSVNLAGLTTALGANTEFTLEIKPPTGAVLNVSRSTPAAIETVMELR
ncbi:MAG: flagellin [Anaerolineaceae bacterium]|nr:flagellin [Anaerolineaceae bacterium]